jgi:hypothetical protein
LDQSQIQAADNCDTDVDIVFAEVTQAGTCAHNYIIIRSWTASDDCGNETIAEQRVLVQDTTSPVLSGAPVDETISCGAIPGPAVTLTATDNCDPNVAVVFNEVSSESAVDCTTSYTITRTWTATDDCGNSSVAEQMITVAGDAEPPSLIGVPSDITFDCNEFPAVNQILTSY